MPILLLTFLVCNRLPRNPGGPPEPAPPVYQILGSVAMYLDRGICTSAGKTCEACGKRNRHA